MVAKGTRSLPEETRKAIAKAYASGMFSGAIAEQFGCTGWMVREVARDAGVINSKRGNRFRAFTEAEVEAMAVRWKAGESQAAIARAVGVCQPIVCRVLAGAGHKKENRRSRGPNHPMWKGGRVRTRGYWMVRVEPDDPLAVMRNRQGYVQEHRYEMARAMGRALTSDETVHHINGDSGDNRLSNLQLRQGRHGKGVVMCCNACGSTDIRARPIA